MNKLGSIVLASVLLASGSAHALSQAYHRQISYDGCVNHGLPDAFCKRVGVEAHNVDRYEWNDPAAHGQMANDGTACDGANATMVREFRLGQEIRHRIENMVYAPSRAESNALARAIGRSLHTIQDNCAHSGMPNRQHSWASLSDTCEGTSISPDVQPDAIECARWATDAVMSAVLDTMSDWGMTKSILARTDQVSTHWPLYVDLCEFLGEAGDWNGGDRQWDNSIVDPALRWVLTTAITSDGAYVWDVCENDSILTSWANDVDVSDGAPGCAKITAFCLGKADGLDEAEEAPPLDDVSAEPPAVAGCRVGGGGAGGGAGLLAVMAAALAFRRRRG